MPIDLEMEEWRAVLNWEGLYEVSNLGRVRRISRQKRGGGLTHVGRLIGHLDVKGYSTVHLSFGLKRRQVGIHRLVLEAFVRRLQSGEVPNHKNFDTADNRLENLEITNQLGNVRHAIANGHVRGLDTYKLNFATAQEIRRLYKGKRQHPYHSELAAQFGTVRENIGKVLRGEIWAEDEDANRNRA